MNKELLTIHLMGSRRDYSRRHPKFSKAMQVLVPAQTDLISKFLAARKIPYQQRVPQFFSMDKSIETLLVVKEL